MAVQLGSPWIDIEIVEIAVIVECVESEPEMVVIGLHTAVALEYRGNQALGIAGVNLESDVDSFEIVSDTDCHRKSDLLAKVRLTLNEVSDFIRFLLERFIQFAVDHRRFVYPEGLHRWSSAMYGVRRQGK